MLALLLPRAAFAVEKVKVLVPDRDNLQYMAFWVAKGGGFFTREGVDVELVVPPGPQQTQRFWETRAADVAVLPPPMYVTLIANKSSVVLVANLLANDPIELIVRRSVLEERKLTPNMPLKERLQGLHDLRIGVAPHPPTRLRALFASQGLDVDKEAKLVILHGKEQNAAFHDREVDVLYAHTPYLERAIVHDDAVVLVDQCRGEVAELANRQIHALAVQRSLLETRHDLVAAMVRAIGDAQALIHRSQSEAVAALAKEMTGRDKTELETIVRLYEPAIPKSPAARAEDIPGALTMFPAGMPKPDLTGIDLTRHVAIDVIDPARVDKSSTPSAPRPRYWMIIAVGVMLAAVIFVVRMRRRA